MTTILRSHPPLARTVPLRGQRHSSVVDQVRGRSATSKPIRVMPVFFETPAKFRAWLRKHASSDTECVVGFYRRGTGKPGISWQESVDEALCVGWIDGVRARIDEAS